MDDVAPLDAFAFLAGGGGMGALMRAHDWAASPLGVPDAWPQSLRTAVGMVINSKFPSCLVWGPELVTLYNDAFRPILGAKPGALGRPFNEVWSEAWETIGPIADRAFAGEATFIEDFPLVVERNGYPEQAYFTFCYSPVRDETGSVAGFLDTVIETTSRVRSERRQEFWLALEDRLRGLADPVAIIEAAARMLAEQLRVAQVGFGEADPRQTHFMVRRDWTDGRLPSAVGVRRMEEFGAAFAAKMKAGETFAVSDAREDKRTRVPDIAAAYEGMNVQSALIVPLIRDGRLRATMFVNHVEPRRWSSEDVLLVEETSARLWSAVERAGAEAELRDSEVRFRALATAGSYSVYRMSPDWTEMRQLDGRGFLPDTDSPSEAWLGTYIHSDDQPRVMAAIRQAVRTKAMFDLEHRVRRADGTLGWTHSRAVPILGADGEVTEWFGAASDVTARRQAEERLALLARASAGLLETPDPDTVLGPVLAEGAAVIGFDQAYIWSVAPDGAHLCLTHAVGVGEEARAALAYAPFNGPLCGVVAETARPLVIEHVLATTEPRYAPAREAGLDAYASYPVFADGSVVSVTSFGCRSRPAFTADELDLFATLARFVSVVQQRLGREASLERRIEARTAELREREEQLHQAQKMEAVGQLTGGLAHDFNNLLTGITGSLERMQARIAQGRISDVDRYVIAAQGAAGRAAALTHRLLAFSRRQTLDPKPTNANRLVAGMEELVRRTVGPAVAVEVAAAGGLWTTLVDPNQLENGLLNLCINARDAMPDGGRLIIGTANKQFDGRAARERDLPPGQYVSLCVSDTGTGMTPEVIAHAFDPFFTTKPTGMGTGLGLSMVYGFARQSGGQVRICSEVGQGAMVCLYLPRHHGEESEVDGQAAAAEPPRTRQQGRTVLVVDDEPTVRMLVTEVLEELGFTAVEAADGAAGLRVLQSDERIDLLVTDVGLPGGMNGRQVADAARQARPDLKVLFITGYAENAAVGNGHLEPGMQVMTKPFAMAALAGRIRELIAGA